MEHTTRYFRIAVLVNKEEQGKFRKEAAKEGLPVSTWLRRLGLKAVEPESGAEAAVLFP